MSLRPFLDTVGRLAACRWSPAGWMARQAAETRTSKTGPPASPAARRALPMVMVAAVPTAMMAAVPAAVVASPVAVMAVPPAPVVRPGRAVVAVAGVGVVPVVGGGVARGIVAVSRIRIRVRVVTAVVGRAVVV